METETITVQAQYWVDAEFDDQSGVSAFGPVGSSAKADDLLITLASRIDCKKATKRREVL